MLISVLALLTGCLLALMVFFNGLLAKHIHPLEASLVIHLIGLLAASIMVFIWRPAWKIDFKHVPKWAYLAGIFGALSVTLIGYSVNTPIGLAGTVGLGVLGQVLYGWANDLFGWFGTHRRRLTLLDLLQALFILTGAGVMIYG